MRSTKKVAGLLVFLCSLCMAACMPVMAADGYETDSYDVMVNVHENQTYDIKEKISVNFLEERHGIYRYIPFKGIMYNKINGEEAAVPYKAGIKNIDVNEVYSESNENSNVVLRIGSEDKTLVGVHNYEISYSYQMYNDTDDGYDLFYLNVLPVGWESSVKETSITVRMPKQFASEDVEVFSGQYGEDHQDIVKYLVEGDEIHITNTEELPEGAGITVRMMLPEDYFTGVASDFGKIVAAIAIGIIGILGMLILWWKYGKDRKYVKTVEFYPPDNLSPAQIGYAADGKVDQKDLISLIIYHAKKGYLTIEEKKKKHGRSEIILHKAGNGIPKSAPSYERSFYKGLLGKQDFVNLKELGEDFYKAYLNASVKLESSFDDPGRRWYRMEDFGRSAYFGHCAGNVWKF